MVTSIIQPVYRQLMAAMVVGLVCLTDASGRVMVEGDVRAPGEEPRIVFDAETVSFGRVVRGAKPELSFRFGNLGAAPLNLLEVKPSCGCTTLGEWPDRLGSGESGELRLTVDTKELNGPVDRTVSIRTNDPTSPRIILHLVGEVWSPISAEPNTVYFPAIKDGTESQQKTVELTNETSDPIAILGVHSSSDRFETSVRPVEDREGWAYELVVTTRPPLDYGVHSGTVTVRTSHPELPAFTLRAQAQVYHPVEASPRAITLARAALGRPFKRYVTLTNHSGDSFDIVRCESSLDGIAASWEALPDAKGFRVAIEIPADLGAAESLKGTVCQLVVHTNHPQEAYRELDVPIVVY